MRNNLCFFMILILGLYSCDSKQVFDEYKTIPTSWHKDSIVSFKIIPPDTINTYNLFVNIRNTSDFKYSNLSGGSKWRPAEGNWAVSKNC